MYPPRNVLMTVKDARHGKIKSDYSDIADVIWDMKASDYIALNDKNRNYTNFLADLKSLMKICDDDDVKIVYLDSDCDEIPIECDDELKEALNFGYYENKSGNYFTVVIKKSNKDDKVEAEIQNISDEKQKQKRICSDSNVQSSILVEQAPGKQNFFRDSNDMEKYRHGLNLPQPTLLNSSPYSATVTVCNKMDKQKYSMKEIKEALGTVNKKVDELKDEFLKIDCNKNHAVQDKAPKWFKDSLEQFKAELLLEVEIMLDERLGIGDSELKLASNGDGCSSKVGYTTLNARYTPKNKKIMRKIEEIIEKEKRLDQRLEKMESKKMKMYEKMANQIPCDVGPIKSTHIPAKSPLRVAPSERFTIFWNLKNTCPYPWTKKTEMRLCENTQGLKPIVTSIKCPELSPNGSGTVAIEFRAPRNEGTYITKWILLHEGKQFGPLLEAEVIVDKNTKKSKSLNDNGIKKKADEKNITQMLAGCSLDREEKALSSQLLSEDVFSADCIGDIFTDDTEEDKSDEEAFVVVPMPPCFFPDAPEGASDPVPVKMKRKSVQSGDKRKRVQIKIKAKSFNNIKTETITPNELDGAVGGTEIPNEPYQSIEGSVYMVDKLGKCFLINDTEVTEKPTTEKKSNHSCESRTPPDPSVSNISQQCLIRDKIKKCVYVDSNGHPFDLPPDKVEKIYPGDPEYNNTVYTVCDGVCVDGNGILRPIPGPNFVQFYFGYSQPQTTQTAHPEFCGPLPYQIPAPPAPPAPPLLFPPQLPPQLYQSFLPPPPPPPPPAHPHIPAGHPPPFHIPGSFPSPNYFHHYLPEQFNNTTQHFDYVHHHHHPVNLTVDKTDVISNRPFGANLNEENFKQEYKKIDENLLTGSKAAFDDNSKANDSASFGELNAGCSTVPPAIPNVRLSVRMKKMKVGENSGCERKKSSKISEIISKKHNGIMFDSSPKKSDASNCHSFHNFPPRVDIQSVSPNVTISLSEVNTEETPEPKVADDSSKQGAPVHILPEGLMNGAITAACSAFSTAVTAINSLRPKVDEMPTETRDERFDRNLAVLHEMGFTNLEKNIELLNDCGDEIERVVERYFSERGSRKCT